jgi:PilZ domain-containing protein
MRSPRAARRQARRSAPLRAVIGVTHRIAGPADPQGTGEAKEGTMPKDLLLLGANAPDMELLRTRLVRVGYRVVPAKTPEMAHTLIRVGGTRIGAVIVPSDLPVVSLRGALDSMRRMQTQGGGLTFVAAGRDPGEEGRRRLRDAGVRIGIFDPVDLHTLRFQINCALADGLPLPPARSKRTTLRAPADWKVVALSGGRAKEGRVYSISPTGAFVVLPQPWMIRSQVELRWTHAFTGTVSAACRVVMTNVPGNVMRRSLPLGMGLRFDHLPEAASVALLMYADQCHRRLAV